jgi:hypothetical protein
MNTRPPMTTREHHILTDSIAAFERTSGIAVHLLRAIPARNRPAAATVRIEAGRLKHTFAASIETVDRFETPALVKARDVHKSPILVAPFITRRVAERCRQLHLSFLDTAGNAYLEGPGLLVYIVGQTLPSGRRPDRFRALTPAGLRIVFALLCHPELIRSNYREIAARAGVALGTVGPVLKDLEGRRLLRLQTGRAHKLLNPERMLEEWVAHFPTTLRPKLSPRRFRADPDRLQRSNLAAQNACWGGEPAAAKLTQYLNPAQLTIYAGEPLAKLVAAGRMRAEENGNVEILEKFWHFDPPKDIGDVAPPILVYADLLATHDGRNVEAARIIYEQRIAPAFRDLA